MRKPQKNGKSSCAGLPVESGRVYRKCRKLAGNGIGIACRSAYRGSTAESITYNMAKYFDKVFEPKGIHYKTHRKNKVRLLSFYGDDGDGGDDDIDITQLSGWGIPERPSPSSPSSLGALEGSKHGRSVATGQPAEKPTGQPRTPVRLRAHERTQCRDQCPRQRHRETKNDADG